MDRLLAILFKTIVAAGPKPPVVDKTNVKHPCSTSLTLSESS